MTHNSNQTKKVVKVHLDPQSFNRKPINQEIAAISNRLEKNKVEILFEELVDRVGNKGQTFCPATFKNEKRINTNFETQDSLWLDFDNGFLFEERLNQLREFGLDASAAYKTFSWISEKPKYRIGFRLLDPLIDKNECDSIQLLLMQIFDKSAKGSDKACKDAARLFFGGKGVIYENFDYVLDLDLLKTAAALLSIENVEGKNKSLHLDKMFKKCKKNAKDHIYIYGTLQKSYKFKQDIQTDFKELRKTILILDSFMAGRDWLYYPQLRGLALNLLHFRGGIQLYKRCLKESGHPYKQKHYDLPTVLKKQYGDSLFPENLSNFSPFEQDWRYKNFIETTFTTGTIKIHTDYSKGRSVDNLREDLTRVNQEVIKNPSPCIYIVKVPTGVGKSYRIQQDFDDSVIAFPNHSLANEFSKDYQKEYKITPKFPEENVKNEVADRYKYLVSSGLQQKTFEFLMKSGDIYAKCYVDDVISFYKENKDSKTIITTHHKALHWLQTNTKSDIKTWVFDEDVFDKLIVTSSIEIGTIHNFINDFNLAYLFHTFLNCIECNNFYCSKNTTDYFKLSDDELVHIENLIFSNYNSTESCKILQLINSHYFVKEGSNIYFCTVNVPNWYDKKIVIYTATPPIFIYEKFLSKFNIKIFDLGNAELKGTLKQYTRYSCSKYNLKKHHKKISYFTREKIVITYIDCKQYFALTDPDIHFKKCVGSNRLEGKSIAVVGNITFPIPVYALYAVAIGLKVEEDDFTTGNRLCKNNVFEFRYKTFERSDLQQIQFALTELELMQAVGRARLVNHDVECLVFSNYPLPIASEFIPDELPDAPEDYEVTPQSYYSLPAPIYSEIDKVRFIPDDILRSLLTSISKEYRIPLDSVLNVVKQTLKDNPEWKRVENEELALHHYIDSLVIF